MDQLDLSEPPLVDLPLSLPVAPAEPERSGFPLLATLAPVGGALVLWAITGSAFSLVFAALGPVVAIASVLDAKRQGRIRLRRAKVVRAALLAGLHAEISRRQESERSAAWRRSPSPVALVTSRVRPAWQVGPLPAIVMGSAPGRSTVRVDGAPADDDDRRLLARAASLDAVPVLAEVYGGIGFVGPPPLARAAARAALVQCAHHGVPGELGLRVPPRAEWAWAARLPHSTTGAEVLRVLDRHDGAAVASARPFGTPVPGGSGSRPRAPGRAAVIAVAADESALPPGLQTIVRVDGPRAAVVWRRDGTPAVLMAPMLVGDTEALAWADAAALTAERAGLGSQGRALPIHVALTELAQPLQQGPSRASLAVAVGALADEPLVIDLVRHGPHALVAGTTGSGKSEFLLAWLTALARAYPPDRVAFLLVDFKGGAAFEPIRDLPQVTGIVTDLGEAEAERAVQSLRAELRHRERVLRQAGVREIRSLGERVDLARLIIVVDEFQAMIERFPDLGAVISDIAARGRSLGVHLVLASQRPNGVVREQVTANCAIRVSLRVMQRADSLAVVGTEQAAEIAPDTPGRGVADRGDGCPVLFQSAIADVAALTGARVANAKLPRARRPWLDPLPLRVHVDELDSLVGSAGDTVDSDVRGADGVRAPGPAAFVIGLADDPDHQRRLRATWAPTTDGHLLVLGAPGSGRTTALAAVGAAVTAECGAETVLALDGPRSVVWDALFALLAVVREGGECPRLLVIDDLDVRFRSWPDDYRLAAFDALGALLREGRGRGLGVAATASQSLGLGAGIRDGFGARLLLRHASRADLVQSGGVGDLWRPDEPPGAAQWRGHRAQVLEAAPRSRAGHPTAPSLELRDDRIYAIVTGSPKAAAMTIRSVGADPILLTMLADGSGRVSSDPSDAPRPRVFVGDADAWAANWALAARIREEAVIVVHGGANEYRTLIRERTLPPLLDEGSGQCWVRSPGHEARRFHWPPH